MPSLTTGLNGFWLRHANSKIPDCEGRLGWLIPQTGVSIAYDRKPPFHPHRNLRLVVQGLGRPVLSPRT